MGRAGKLGGKLMLQLAEIASMHSQFTCRSATRLNSGEPPISLNFDSESRAKPPIIGLGASIDSVQFGEKTPAVAPCAIPKDCYGSVDILRLALR
jgi:hypothetical protein